jgi:hypothetical protein
MDPMTTIQYLIVVEGTAPDADAERVEQILRKIWPDPARSLADLPLELPRRFDLRGASEWIEALTRAGLRARVEVEGMATAAALTTAAGDDAAEAPGTQAGNLPASPWALWAALLRDPEPILAAMPSAAPGRAILFGWLAGAVGGTLALPAELWLLRQFDPEIGLASGASLLGAMLLVEPLLRLAVWTLALRMLLGIGGVAAGWRETGALVGLAQAWQPLRAIPILGAVLATFGALWYTGAGIGERFALSPRRLVGLLLLPLVVAAVAAVGIGVLVAAALTNLPELIPSLGRWPI